MTKVTKRPVTEARKASMAKARKKYNDKNKGAKESEDKNRIGIEKKIKSNLKWLEQREKEDNVLIVPKGTIVKIATTMDDLIAERNHYKAMVVASCTDIAAHKAFLKSELEKG